ncbi:hypothetical protein [Sphingobium sp. Ant17]|uniref:hypothetical protein n=1 Tax=Sphingobium sp. Ant17 TaxID=1461752 RepID=UPI0004B84CDE
MTLHSGETLRARACHIATLLSVHGARHWKWLTFLIWIAIAVTMVVTRWSAIHWLVLGDTDDNIRYVQVKDWLAGQAGTTCANIGSTRRAGRISTGRGWSMCPWPA